jgi:hypothetical protein
MGKPRFGGIIMATAAQVEANRSNAQQATGPRTPEGKATVAQNAVTHGLLAKEAVIVGEDFDQFDLYRDQIRAELAPVGLVESLLAERIVGLSWRLQRAERFHTEAFDTLYEKLALDPRARPAAVGPDRGDPLFGGTVVKDFSETKVLERLLMYERRIEGSLYRTMAELRKVRGQREAAGGTNEVSSLTCPVSSEASRAWDPPASNLPLPTSDSAVATSEESADSVGTNVRDVEEESCETNPIFAPAVETPHPSTIPSFQDSNPRPEAQGQSCETKPIGVGATNRPAGYRPIFRRRR